MTATDLGLTIRAARIGHGWTQRSLAEHANVSRPTVARIEGGQDISAMSLSKIAASLTLELVLRPVKAG